MHRLVFSLPGLAALVALAQPAAASDPVTIARGVSALRSAAGPSAHIRFGSAGTVRFADLRGLPSGAITPRALVRAHGDALGLTDPDRELVELEDRVDALGHRRVVYRQERGGVPVLGSRVTVHLLPSGQPRAVTAAVGRVDGLPTSSSVTATQAESRVVADLRASHGPGPWRTTVELGLLDPELLFGRSGVRRLAYQVEIRNGRDVRQVLFVDATTGRIVERFDAMQTINRRIYDGRSQDSDIVWEEGDPPYAGPDPQVQDAIDFSEDTYDILRNLSESGGYLSFDGMDARMDTVLNAEQLDCPNASWNGEVTSYCDGLLTDDVVAHEWAHAYTQYTHGLIYSVQPGALNEAYSDIFGEAVDLLNGAGVDEPSGPREAGVCTHADPDGSVRWLIGEEVVGLFTEGNALRDMWEPNCRNDPGAVGDDEYHCGEPDENGNTDNGGVHTNSGIPNRAFALLVDGGDGVDAIGMTKALHIYWRAMTVYQGPQTVFAEHFEATWAACLDFIGLGANLSDPLTGAPSGQFITEADCFALEAAHEAVEMTDSPSCPGIVEPEVMPACNGSELYRHSFAVVPREWIVSSEGVSPDAIIADWGFVADPPMGRERHGGAMFAEDIAEQEGCQGRRLAAVTHLDGPSIVLPEGDYEPRLSFNHYARTEVSYDGGNVKVSVNDGPWTPVAGSDFLHNPYNLTLVPGDNPIAGEEAFSGGEYNPMWGQSIADLSAYANPGDTIRIRFDFGVDGCAGLEGWYVADVEVRACDGVVGETEGLTDGGSDGTDTGAATDGPAGTSGPDPETDDGSDLPPEETEDTSVDSEGGQAGATVLPRGCACNVKTPGPRDWAALALLPIVIVARRRRH